jgi:hypothetical protein
LANISLPLSPHRRGPAPVVIARLAYLRAVADECRALAADSSPPVAGRLMSLVTKLESMMREQDPGRPPFDPS